MVVVNIISLFFISIIIPSFFKQKYLKLILSVIFGIFFCIQLSSLYLGNSFIDYKFYFHFNLKDTISIAKGFSKEIFLISILLIIIPYFFYFLSLIMPDKKKHISTLSKRLASFLTKCKNYRLCSLLILSSRNIFIKFSILIIATLIIFFSNNGIYRNLKEIYDITSVQELNVTDFNKELDNLGNTSFENKEITSKPQNVAVKKKCDEEYIKKENLEATFGGKNIIIISLESFERAFLHDMNKELTPNLRSLKERWSYLDMKQNDGSAWTAGSLYTVFTGFPCFFAGPGNEFFQNSTSCKIVTLGDILNKCGYVSYHLSSDANYAGTRDILRLFKIDSIMDGTFHGKYPSSNTPWGGVYDKDLFTEAKEVLLRRDKQKPFFLFMSTLSTHCPNGFVDERMLQFIKKQNTTLETAALSTDWLVENFIEFLQKENLLNNTIVYLFPDHLMLCEQEIFNKTKQERGLWLMTNADSNDLSIQNNNFYQIDLTKNILSGAKIKYNAKFLSDFINEDKEVFIRKNTKKISILNASSIIRDKTIGESLNFTFKNNKITCLVNKDTLFTEESDSLVDSNIVVTLNNGLRILSYQKVANQELDRFCKCLPSYYLIVSLRNKHINFEWSWDNEHKYSVQNATLINLNSSQIQNIVSSITPKDAAPIVDKGIITDSIIIKQKNLVNYLNEVLKDNSKIVIISAYDDASLQFHKIQPVLQRVGLKETLDHTFGWSYLSVFSNSKVFYESSSVKMRFKKLSISGVTIYLESGGLKDNSPSNIVIKNKEFSLSRRGLNIVIFDGRTQKVVDSFNVNTCDDPTITINR
jgi:hypothetical protein